MVFIDARIAIIICQLTSKSPIFVSCFSGSVNIFLTSTPSFHPRWLMSSLVVMFAQCVGIILQVNLKPVLL